MPFRFLFVLLSLTVFTSLHAQKSRTHDLSKGGYVFVDLAGDTILYRERAAITLRHLRDGSVRLKTSDRTLDAYKKAGQLEIAQKIEDDRKAQNQKIYDAFKNYFTFCKVYFIYAKDTKKFLEGDRKIFLNQNLEYDFTLNFTDTNFVFCEYGTVESFSKFTDQSAYAVDRPSISGGSYTGAAPHEIMDTVTRRTSTSPATTSALFFSDKNLKQFQRPFPYSEAVYFNNPYPAVRTLNRQMERVYSRLITSDDFRIILKEEKKKERLKKKASPKYNPFK